MIKRRDERGWHIPGPGTKSKAIYDMLVNGAGANEIYKRFGRSGYQLARNIMRPSSAFSRLSRDDRRDARDLRKLLKRAGCDPREIRWAVTKFMNDVAANR